MCIFFYVYLFFFFYGYGDHRDLHVLTPSFPTRRSSDLAQKRVLKEIRHDTRSGLQMNRLLQGDVGSGKTVIALMSMLLAVDNGLQACMMAPTELLAVQHYNSIGKLLDGMELPVALLTGSTPAAERKVIFSQLQEGSLPMLIGTHALIEEAVQFKNLGLAVVDEQHRFGVEQDRKSTRLNS